MKVNISPYKKNGFQKVEVDIQRHDILSMDYTLALIILPMLLYFKEQRTGVPGQLYSEHYGNQYEFSFVDENLAENYRAKKWEDILDKMIWSFQQIIEDATTSKYSHGTFDFKFKKSKKKFTNPVTGKQETVYVLEENENNTYWFDDVGYDLHNKRIQEGLKLFGEYYSSLWI